METILVCDDDPVDCALIREVCALAGGAALGAADAATTLALARQQRASMIIIDASLLPPRAGAWLAAARGATTPPPALVVWSYAPPLTPALQPPAGWDLWLLKPTRADAAWRGAVAAALARLLARRRSA